MPLIYKDEDFSFGMPSTEDQEAYKELTDKTKDQLVINPANDDRKLSTDNGKAQVYVTDSTVAISNESNCIVVNDKGIIVNGRTHITKNPSSIRINGFWVLNEELLTGLPSTVYTPIPVLLYKEIPYAKIARSLTSLLV